MKEPKDKHIDRLQENKRTKSPTSTEIRKAMREKYPIGFPKKPKKSK